MLCTVDRGRHIVTLRTICPGQSVSTGSFRRDGVGHDPGMAWELLVPVIQQRDNSPVPEDRVIEASNGGQFGFARRCSTA
jgi:hypothetical protein